MPTGFSIIPVTNKVENVSCFTFVDEHTILLAKQNGEIYQVKDGVTSEQPIVRIPTITAASGGDRGLVGINIDPEYPQSPYVYVTYTVESATHNRVSRFRYANSTIDLSSEEVLLNLSPIYAKWHVGGAIVFDDQGHLFTTTGDNSTPDNAQDMNTTHGKLIRINKDGSIPTDNPFYGNGGLQDLFWAIGLRNPYTMAIHKGTNTIFVNDVGKTDWEEINDASLGGRNFGWPIEDGYNKEATSPYVNPTYAYAHSEGLTDSTGVAITGGAFYEAANPKFPNDYLNKYFFLEFGQQWINTISPEMDGHDHVHDLAGTRETFGTNIPKGGIYLTLGYDGYLYFFSRIDNTLYKIVFYDSQEPLILVNPENTTTMVGERTRFSVTAVGADTLHYEWFKDGSPLASAADSPVYSFGNTQEDRTGNYQVRVYNDFGEAISNEVSLNVIPFNEKPSITFISPVDSTFYQAGQQVTYKARATDKEEGELPADRFEWFLDFHHNDHIHDGPAIATGVKEGTFTIPDVGETSSNVWYKIRLRVRDELGQVVQRQRRLYPLTTDISFRTEPPGLRINIDGPSYETPLTRNFVEHLKLPVGSPGSQTLQGDRGIYRLSHWSEPVENSFYTIPEESSELVAYFERCTEPNSIDDFYYTRIGNRVILEWSTASSACTEGFIIEDISSEGQIEVTAHYDQTYYEFEVPDELEPGKTYEFKLSSFNENGTSPEEQLAITLSDLNGDEPIDYLYYPNPTTDHLTIKNVDISRDYTLQLFTLNGRTVKQDGFWSFDNNDIIVDFSDLQGGLYFLTVTADNKSETLKIVVY